jgi:hypothetical protein
VGSIVLLGAEHVLAALTDEAQVIAARALHADREANGEGVLRALVGRLEIGTAGSIPFSGDSGAVRFSSWCEVPASWLERCAVTLAFDSIDRQPVLVARLDHAAPIVLVRGFSRGAFRYLESAAAGGQWFEQWGTGITAPLGIGALLDRGARTDTLLLRVGPRG